MVIAFRFRTIPCGTVAGRSPCPTTSGIGPGGPELRSCAGFHAAAGHASRRSPVRLSGGDPTRRHRTTCGGLRRHVRSAARRPPGHGHRRPPGARPRHRAHGRGRRALAEGRRRGGDSGDGPAGHDACRGAGRGGPRGVCDRGRTTGADLHDGHARGLERRHPGDELFLCSGQTQRRDSTPGTVPGSWEGCVGSWWSTRPGAPSWRWRTGSGCSTSRLPGSTSPRREFAPGGSPGRSLRSRTRWGHIGHRGARALRWRSMTG